MDRLFELCVQDREHRQVINGFLSSSIVDSASLIASEICRDDDLKEHFEKAIDFMVDFIKKDDKFLGEIGHSVDFDYYVSELLDSPDSFVMVEDNSCVPCDFLRFIIDAYNKGIKIISDFVYNDTSDKYSEIANSEDYVLDNYTEFVMEKQFDHVKQNADKVDYKSLGFNSKEEFVDSVMLVNDVKVECYDAGSYGSYAYGKSDFEDGNFFVSYHFLGNSEEFFSDDQYYLDSNYDYNDACKEIGLSFDFFKQIKDYCGGYFNEIGDDADIEFYITSTYLIYGYVTVEDIVKKGKELGYLK